MERIRRPNILHGYRREKRNVLVAAAIFAALMGPPEILFRERSVPAQLFSVILVVGTGILMLGWCYYDALERNRPLGSGFRVLIVLFGLLALFIYLIRSRGFGRGLLAAGLALLVIAGCALISGASMFVTILIFGIEPRF